MSQTHICLLTPLPVVAGRIALSCSMPCPQTNPGKPIFLLCVPTVPVLTQVLRCWSSASFGVRGIPSSSSTNCPEVGIPRCGGTCAVWGARCRVIPGLLSPQCPRLSICHSSSVPPGTPAAPPGCNTRGERRWHRLACRSALGAGTHRTSKREM